MDVGPTAKAAKYRDRAAEMRRPDYRPERLELITQPDSEHVEVHVSSL